MLVELAGLYVGPCPHSQHRTLKMKPQPAQPRTSWFHLSHLLPSSLCASLVTGRAPVSGRWVKVKLLLRVQLGGACRLSLPGEQGVWGQWEECTLVPSNGPSLHWVQNGETEDQRRGLRSSLQGLGGKSQIANLITSQP